MSVNRHFGRGLVWLLLALFPAGCFGAVEECSRLALNPPRGFQCLHCLRGSTRRSAALLTEALLRSCQRNVALGFALDGAFGVEMSTIVSAVTRLTSSGRNVHLHLYLLNGPAQRRAFSRPFPGFMNRANPTVFRRQILSSPAFRAAYQEFIASHAAVFELSRNPAVMVTVAPMLEDNLTDAQFGFLLAMTREFLAHQPALRFVRNPCRDCYYRNGSAIPPDVIAEEHLVEPAFSTTDGIVSNDGWGYLSFDGEPRSVITRPVRAGSRRERSVTLDELRPLLDRATLQNDTFLLWIAKYQQTLPGSRSQLPQHRTYPIPTADEVRQLAAFLGRS